MQNGQDIALRKNERVGIGGYRCPCCGPSLKERRRHRRRLRRVGRQAWKREVLDILSDRGRLADAGVQ